MIKEETLSSKIYNTRKGSGRYTISGDTLAVQSSNVGVGLKVYDHMTGAPNWNGIYELEMYCDDSLAFRFQVDKLDFDERRYLNAHIDYKEKVKHKSFFNRCFILPGNKNSQNYKDVYNNGVINVKSGKTTKVELISKDLEGNTSKVLFWLKKNGDATPPSHTFQYIVPYDEESIIQQSEITLHFQPDAFYETQYFSIYSSEDDSDDFFSNVHHIHDATVPVHIPYKISIRPTKLPKELRDKAVIVKCSAENKIAAQGSKWEEDFLTTEALSFGDYAIMIDTFSTEY